MDGENCPNGNELSGSGLDRTQVLAELVLPHVVSVVLDRSPTTLLLYWHLRINAHSDSCSFSSPGWRCQSKHLHEEAVLLISLLGYKSLQALVNS